MAWNEPGGNRNDRDPWGGGNRGGGNNGGNNQGPPDLDEALKKGLEKLNGLLGGKKGGGGSSGSGGGSGQSGNFGMVLALIGIILFGFLAYQSVYLVDERENGVVLRFGKYHTTTMPGLNFKLPLVDDVRLVTVTDVRSFRSTGAMLTEDENIVNVNLAVQYRVNDPRQFVLNVRNPQTTLQYATDSALRHEVGSSGLHGVLTDRRAELAVLVEERLQRFLDSYTVGMQILRVNVESTQPPDQVQDAFQDVQRAREDEQRFKDEAERYRNRVVPEARGRAQRMIEEAEAYRAEVVERAAGEASRFLAVLDVYSTSPDVTRERMYVEAMTNVLSRTSKVIVDVDEGNNMMMLPLDRMQQAGGAQALSDRRRNSDAVPYDMQELTDRVIEEMRNRDSGNTRRGR
ncbi:MAG: FtsH protease activity modulator HflK [Halomonadaceae bacterium]|nr:MAG: FtsH protease activity modulator HflK [Halomonadaceae bacterium]